MEMSCGGCSGAVERALKRMQGVQSVKCSLESQTVQVAADLPRTVLYEAIKKTGKKVEM